MKNKLVSLSLVVLALVAASGAAAVAQANPWTEYRSADNSFAVNVPAPFRVTAHQVITPRGPVAAPLFSQQEAGNSYFVSYVDLPGNYLATTEPQRILESGIASILQSRGATLETKTDLAMNSFTGKAFTGSIHSFGANGQTGVVHARVYLGSGRLYYVFVTGAGSDTHNALAARYLESFRILKDVAHR